MAGLSGIGWTSNSDERRTMRCLQVLVRRGPTGESRRMQPPALWPRPERRTIEQVLKPVASRRAVCGASEITHFTSASVISQRGPGLGFSRSPPGCLPRDRRRHLPTLWPVSPIWTRGSTSRARCVRAWRVFVAGLPLVAGLLVRAGFSFGRAEHRKWQRFSSRYERLLSRVRIHPSTCMAYL